jgi:hypothetical protein
VRKETVAELLPAVKNATEANHLVTHSPTMTVVCDAHQIVRKSLVFLAADVP